MGRASVNSVQRALFEMREAGEVIIASREVFDLFKQQMDEMGVSFDFIDVIDNDTGETKWLCWMENESEVMDDDE